MSESIKKYQIIGLPTDLPNPHKLTFTGAVTAEYDGSEAVEVKIPEGGSGGGIEVTGAEVGQTIVVKAVDENGKPTEWAAAEWQNDWKVIVDITTTEEVTWIGINKDLNGNPFELIDARISIKVANTNTNESEAALQIRTNHDTAANGGSNTSATRMFRKGTGANYTMLRLSATDNHIFGTVYNIGNQASAISGYCNKTTGQPFSALYLSGGTFGVGSRVLIEGVRA